MFRLETKRLLVLTGAKQSEATHDDDDDEDPSSLNSFS